MISCHVGFKTCFNLDSLKLKVLNIFILDTSTVKGDTRLPLIRISSAFSLEAGGKIILSEDAVVAKGRSRERDSIKVEEDERVDL